MASALKTARTDGFTSSSLHPVRVTSIIRSKRYKSASTSYSPDHVSQVPGSPVSGALKAYTLRLLRLAQEAGFQVTLNASTTSKRQWVHSCMGGTTQIILAVTSTIPAVT